MVCDKCLNDDCYCNRRKEYDKLYREQHKIKTRILCQCGLSYNTYNSKIHINRHNKSRKHLKYLYDNSIISIIDYVPAMTIIELYNEAKKNNIDVKNKTKDVLINTLIDYYKFLNILKDVKLINMTLV